MNKDHSRDPLLPDSPRVQPKQPHRRNPRNVARRMLFGQNTNLLVAGISLATIALVGVIFLVVLIPLYLTLIQARLPPDDRFPYQAALVIIGMISAISLFLIFFIFFNRKVKLPWGWCVAGMFIVLMLVFEGFIQFGVHVQPRVEITRSGFAQTDVTVFQDASLSFSNSSDGVTQVLCVGSHLECRLTTTVAKDIPAQLYAPGLRLQPGQSVSLAFPTGGTYSLISTTTPGMIITIHVMQADNSDDNFPGSF